jgi:hypothetical protein
MAAVAKSGTPSLSTVLPGGNCFVGSNLKAGAAIAAGDACYIASTGLVLLATGAANTAPAQVDGFAAAAAASGEAVTLLTDVDMHYGSGLTPGVRYYLSGTTAGGLDTATSTGGLIAIAKAIDTTRVRVYANR